MGGGGGIGLAPETDRRPLINTSDSPFVRAKRAGSNAGSLSFCRDSHGDTVSLSSILAKNTNTCSYEFMAIHFIFK